jgi:lipoprotein-releasing system permease protein
MDRYQNSATDLLASTGSDGADVEEGAPGAVRIRTREGRRYVPGVAYPEQVRRAVGAFSEVEAIASVLTGPIQVASGFRAESAEMLGIEPVDYVAVSALADQVRVGSLARFRDDPFGILIGSRLAERIVARPGDLLTVRSGERGEGFRFRVSGIFETGAGAIDLRRVYIHLNRAREIARRPSGVSYLQLDVRDPGEAEELAAHLRTAIWHDARSWQERERTWLEVFRVLRISSGITMIAILTIAGLGMFSTLAIIAMERRRDIAILRSMGYTRGDIAAIFLQQGAIVLVTGVTSGMLLGAVLTWVLGRVPVHIRGIFSTDRFVVAWDWTHYAWALVLATLIVGLASLLPSRRAAAIEPGEIVRGAGG